MFLGSKCGRCVGLTILSLSVSRLSRECEILKISQPYWPLRPVAGTALLYTHYDELWLSDLVQAKSKLQIPEALRHASPQQNQAGFGNVCDVHLNFHLQISKYVTKT
jgi:hypothetical protein